MQQINYNQHFVDKSDLASIIKTSKSKNLTQGKKVKKFEENLCNFTGAKHCITTNTVYEFVADTSYVFGKTHRR